MPQATDSLFSPDGVEFRPVSSELIKVRMVGTALFVVPLFIGACVAAYFLAPYSAPYLWAAPVAVALLGAWIFWLIPRQIRAMGYAETEDDLLWRRGILFRSLTVVPYGRMQYVDVSEGPIDRHFGIAGVKLHTASASTDATIPGLPAEEAARLRRRLSELGEARMAGL